MIQMSLKYLLVIALVWLGDLAPRHGVLGRYLESHGENGGILPGDARPALMKVPDAKAGRDISHWAGYRTAEGKYYGTVARINAWDLKLKPGQISSSVMWLSSDGNNNQIMAAGFQISPDAYNDTDLHFFVSWTADGFNSTGCLNTQCQGFVSSTPPASISPASTVAQPSVYHGKQADFTITILKDLGSRKWSLYVDVSGTKQELVGHFPASLFTGLLADHATEVSWGGNAWSSASAGAAPPMGSGHGPGQGLGGSAYIASIGVFDAGGNSSTPAAANVTSLTDAKECYDASVFQVTNDDGAFFYYGGPNGCDH